MSTTNKEFNARNGALIGTSSANYLQLLGGSAGNSVAINALGSDTNISISLIPKGTGTVNIPSGTNLTLTNGTANGVLYLNGSKAATSGSALTFDGTNFGVGAGGVFRMYRPDGAIYTVQYMGAGATGGFVWDNMNGDGFRWLFTGSEQMRISSDGTFRVKGAGTAGSTDAVQFSGSAPANSLALDSSGNLGIGTSSPAYILDVRKPSGTTIVNIGSGGVSNSGSALLLSGASSYKNWTISNNYNIGGALEFVQTTAVGGMTIGSTSAMLLDSSGVVGIGTSAVAGNQDYLRIAGNTNSASDYHAFGNYSTNELYIQPNTYTNILRGYAYTSSNRKMNGSDAAIKITNNSILLAYDTGNVNVGYTSDQGYKLAVNGSVSIGTIRNAAGIKTYSVSTTSQGNVNSTYEIMQISRDSVNWSNGIGYEITVYNRYYRGGMTKWFVTFNQVDSGTATCISSVGTFLHKVYLGTEVIVSGTIGYRPVLVDIPNYEFVSIEVKYTSGEVSTINAANQVKFTGTYTTGTGTNYSGDTMLVPNGGNVGIGVTPSYKLDINGVVNIAPSNSSGVQQGLRLYDAGSGALEGLYIQWESASRSDMARILAAGDSTGGYLAFNTNNANTGTSTERMRIDPVGRVLVGLTGAGTYEANTKTNLYTSGTSQVFNLLQLTNQGTPGTGDIVGIGFAAGETTQYGVKGSIGFVRTSSYGLGALAFYTNNTSSTQNVSTSDERMRISSDGTFRVKGAGTAGSTDAVQFSGSAPASSLLLDSIGNLGIGITSAAQKLEVNTDSGSYQMRLGSGATSSLYTYDIGRSSTDGYFRFYGNQSGANGYIFGGIDGERMRISSDGTFRVKGAGSAGSTDAVQFSGSAPANSLLLDSIGNLGIGITSAAQKLEVNTDSGSYQMRLGSGATSSLYTYDIGRSSTDGYFRFYGNQSGANGYIFGGIDGERMRITSGGNVLIGTTTDGGYKLQVNGSFAATTKSFLIDHPTKEGMKLRYGSLESPYHGVRLTGEGVLINGIATVELPDYIQGLCKQEGAQVQITNIKHGKVIWVEDIEVDNNKFTVAADINDDKEYRFYWSFTAIRKDIEDMIVEF